MLYPFKALPFILKRPALLMISITPVAINSILYIIFFLLSLRYFNGWLDSLMPQSDAWYFIILSYLLLVVFVLLLLVMIVFTFALVANLLASPFNDALSSRSEAEARGVVSSDPFSLSRILMETGRAVIEELKKLFFFLLVLGLLLLLNIVPILGSGASVILSFCFTIFWLGFAFIDYALARHGLRLGAKLRFLMKNIFPVWGFGAGVFVGLLVPVLNLAFIPLAVVGGTLMYVDLTPDEQV